MRSQYESTGALSASLRMIGSSATWAGASLGGMITPLSSPWTMIRPPISRVDTPQVVVQAYSSLPSRDWNLMPEALAKFWPRKWVVPACSALRSCIMASMQYVSTAPGKRSPAVFSPVMTGIAM